MKYDPIAKKQNRANEITNTKNGIAKIIQLLDRNNNAYKIIWQIYSRKNSAYRTAVAADRTRAQTNAQTQQIAMQSDIIIPRLSLLGTEGAIRTRARSASLSPGASSPKIVG